MAMGVPANKAERDPKFAASESVRNHNEILHQYVDLQGERAGSALTHPAFITRHTEENSIFKLLCVFQTKLFMGLGVFRNDLFCQKRKY